MKTGFTTLLLCLIALSGSLSAQTITGSITGTVTDASGAVVPNVKVSATNQATNVATDVVTNQSGVYFLRFLPIGNYTVTVEAKGFKKSSAGPFTLETDQIARIDVKLEVGDTTQTVEIQDIAPVLQTESASTGATITSTQATNVPLRGRNFASLTLLVPGSITPNPSGFDSIAHNSGGGRPYVNGNREQTNNFLLDGADVNESIDNLIGYQPNVDALAEVKVQTGNMGAEFGNANGAVVNMSIKSGSNRFNGNVFEFMNLDDFNANGFVPNRSNVKRNQYKRNVFGGTLGGPIKRDQTFFFVDYQGARQRVEGPASAAVAPLAWRTGNMSSVTNRQIKDPTNGQFFPNNVIPSSRIVNPAALKLVSGTDLYPVSNNVGVGPLGVTSNYLGRSASYVDNDQADAKVDHRLSDKDSLMGRFSIRRVRQAPTRLNLPTSIGTLTTAPTTGGVINWTRTITPSIVNEARMNFNRVRISDTPADIGGQLGPDGNADFGIPGGQPVEGLSELRINGVEGLTNPGSIGISSDNITNTWQYSDNLTWQKGRHFLKMGGQAIRYQQNRFYSGNNGVLGYMTYIGVYTNSSWADFLLDQLNQKGRGSNTGNWGHRQWRSSLFLQDDWKVSDTFTLNIGLRWEYSQPIYEVADRQINVDIYSGKISSAGQNGASRALYKAYPYQYMPRFGFAWAPKGLGAKTVVRGGYGITSYLEGTGANLRLPLNPPFFFESDVTYSVTAPGSTSSGFTGLNARDQLAGLVRAWNPDLRPAFIQQYNLSVEHQLSNTSSITVGYVGQRGTHLVNPREGNQANAGPGAVDPRRPLYGVLPLVTQIAYTDSSSIMNYNGLQATGRKRLSGGLEFLASYTWSKSMTDNLGYYGSGGVAGMSPYWQDANNRIAEYGPSFFDATHNFTLSGSYDLPWGKGRKFGTDMHRALDMIAGGWNLGFIYSAHTGFPITINAPGRVNAGNRANRANRYGELVIENQSIDNWFGTHPSAKPCAANSYNGTCAYGQQYDFRFGSAGVSTERAPNFFNYDFTVMKNFTVTEKQYLQFRAEFFNAFNNVSFGPPNRDTSSAQFGFINSQINPPRNIQLALKYYF